MGGPFEVYGELFSTKEPVSAKLNARLNTVSKPATFDFATVRSTLHQLVNLCLEADPSLIPASFANNDASKQEVVDEDVTPASDDFRFWSENQAKRISYAIKMAFGVECSYELVLADANVTDLTRRVLAAKEMSE